VIRRSGNWGLREEITITARQNAFRTLLMVSDAQWNRFEGTEHHPVLDNDGISAQSAWT